MRRHLMMTGDTMGNQEKPQIQYPCLWQYKVISTDRQVVRRRIAALLQDVRCEISDSHSSRTGRYACLNVEIEVRDETMRNTVYRLLREMETVKFVL